MESLKLDKFLKIAAIAARARGQIYLAEGIEVEGPRCRIFDRCAISLQKAQFSMELEAHLRREPGFAPDFQIPDAIMRRGEIASQFFRAICELAGVRADSTSKLQTA